MMSKRRKPHHRHRKSERYESKNALPYHQLVLIQEATKLNKEHKAKQKKKYVWVVQAPAFAACAEDIFGGKYFCIGDQTD
jgi:hypothetical protein